MEYSYVPKRLTELRLKKGVSEYKMSLDLGHTRSYMQNITSGRSKLPMEEFLYICDYFNITPKSFFDEKEEQPILLQKALDGMRGLSDRDLLILLGLIDRMNDRK